MSDDEPKFGELKEMRMREVWAHEAYNFTPWLADNIHTLGKALDLRLRAKQTEVAVGSFSLDLLAEEEGTGRVVAIENQFNQTDHSHLGQLLTYAAGCDASIVIWIMEYARDEHRAAVEWLNRKTGTETHFYLVSVKILQIDDSLPVYQFVPVVASNKREKEQSAIEAAYTPEDLACKNYFSEFVQELKEKKFPYRLRNYGHITPYRLYANDINKWYRWSYKHEFHKDGHALVYLVFHGNSAAEAETLWKQLEARKEKIDGVLKMEWDWGSFWSIGISRAGSFSDSEETLAEIRAWAVDNIIKLAEAIPPEMLREIEKTLEVENGE